MAVNSVTVIGNLGATPEVRSLPSGQSVANISLATTERFTDRNGGKQQRTEWHRIVAFGKLAETCGQYLSKGRQVYVEGRLTSPAPGTIILACVWRITDFPRISNSRTHTVLSHLNQVNP